MRLAEPAAVVTGFRGSVAVPSDAWTLPGFRRWALSDDFPQHARVDFLDGVVHVDVAGVSLASHGRVLTEFVTTVSNRVRACESGEVTTSRTRVTLPAAAASVTPDLAFVSYDSLAAGRLTETPADDGTDSIEFVGPPDLLIEIVSPSSVKKDVRRLLDAYFIGGVTEYWLVDCRDDDAPPAFTLHRRGDDEFEPVPPDADGFAASAVLGKSYRLTRTRGRLGRWQYRLEER